MFPSLAHDRLASRPVVRLHPKMNTMVDLLELCMLRILNEKNNEKALDFPVKAFSMLSEFEQLTLAEIVEMTGLDHGIMQPIMKKLLKQRIVRCKNCKLSINKNLNSIHKLIN